MDNLTCAIVRSSELNTAINDKEVSILEALQQGVRMDAVSVMESELAALVADADDADTIVKYYQRIGDMQRNGDVYKLVFQIERNGDGDDSSLAAASVQWSSKSMEATEGVSGVVIAATSVLFGILEGEEDLVLRMATEVIKGESHIVNPSTFMAVQRTRAHSRQYPMGIKLHFIEDPTMDTILSKCREVVALGDRFAPHEAAEVAVRGGNPNTEVITPYQGLPILLVTLCFKAGVVHSPSVYSQLANAIEGLILPFGGSVVEAFGEHMIVTFPRRGKWPSTCIMEVATPLLRPGGAGAASGMGPSDLHVIAHMGDVTFINKKHCIAIGEGIRQVKALAYVAEASQRPLIISPIVLLHCSKAAYRTIPFSHNTVGYHTFPDLELTRSVMLPEPFKIEAPSGMRVVDTTQEGRGSSSTVKIVPATKEELRLGTAASHPIEGGDAQVEEYKAHFRRLDPKGEGWITKSVLRKFLLSNELFVVFPHDAPRIDGWIADLKSLGQERLSVDEFLFLCVRMRQL